MAFSLTEHHLELASKAGEVHAEAEFLMGNPGPVEQVLDEEDQRKLVYTVTGVKLALDSDEATFIVTAYEDAYYDAWAEKEEAR